MVGTATSVGDPLRQAARTMLPGFGRVCGRRTARGASSERTLRRAFQGDLGRRGAVSETIGVASARRARSEPMPRSSRRTARCTARGRAPERSSDPAGAHHERVAGGRWWSIGPWIQQWALGRTLLRRPVARARRSKVARPKGAVFQSFGSGEPTPRSETTSSRIRPDRSPVARWIFRGFGLERSAATPGATSPALVEARRRRSGGWFGASLPVRASAPVGISAPHHRLRRRRQVARARDGVARHALRSCSTPERVRPRGILQRRCSRPDRSARAPSQPSGWPGAGQRGERLRPHLQGFGSGAGAHGGGCRDRGSP